MLLYEAGVVHCDIKAGNVVLFADGNVKLIDFSVSERIPTGADHVKGVYCTPVPPPEADDAETGVLSAGRTDLWALAFTIASILVCSVCRNNEPEFRECSHLLLKCQYCA